MPIRVHGLQALVKANSQAEPNLRKEFKRNYRDVAEPVRSAAESLAMGVGNIPHSPAWGRMRTGTTTRVLYVAPKQRGSKGGRKRPNMGGLLMNRAMQPALDRHESQIARRFEGFLAAMERHWGR